MSLEGFSKRGMELGTDPEGIKETKNDLIQQYIRTIERLALQKMKNDLLFDGQLNAEIRRFNSLGLSVSRDSMLDDIEEEIRRQHPSYGLSIDDIRNEMLSSINRNQQVNPIEVPGKEEVEQLKRNIENIFETPSAQHPLKDNSQDEKNIVQKPNEQSFDDVYDSEIKKLVELKNNNSVNYEEELNKTIAKLSALSDRIPNIRAQIESDVKYGLSRLEEKTTLTREHQQIAERMKQAQEKLSSTLEWASNQPNEPQYVTLGGGKKEPFPEWTQDRGVSGYITPEVSKVDVKQEHQVQFEEPKIEQKADLVSQIINEMNQAGELSFGDISMNERMYIMKNLQSKLTNKSIDELRLLLSSYQQDMKEEKTSGMGK